MAQHNSRRRLVRDHVRSQVASVFHTTINAELPFAQRGRLDFLRTFGLTAFCRECPPWHSVGGLSPECENRVPVRLDTQRIRSLTSNRTLCSTSDPAGRNATEGIPYRVAGIVLCLLLSLLVTAARADDTPAPEFFRAFNLNGPAVEVDGHAWEGNDSPLYSTSDGAFENQDVPLVPPTDEARALMIRSSRYSNNGHVELTQIPPGEYSVFVYFWEDNDSQTFTLSLQGEEVARDLQSGAAGEWQRVGPFVTTLDSEGSLVINTTGGHANLSGIEVWRGAGAIPGPGESPEDLFPEVAADVAERFHNEIAPLLSRHCLECHNDTMASGGLNLAFWKDAQAGGESGPAFIAGDAESSLAFQYVAGGDMPKERPALSPDEQETLRKWIADGAVWGEARIDPFLATTDRRAGYDWWSLQPVTSPDPPAVQHSEWCRNEVDYFILAKLEGAGLTPADEADKLTLLRRLTFDLTGLPPTPEEMQEFLYDESPDAYARVVDRLLASPHYGERWGRHWLDVIRFGESQGYERNRIRPNAWRFRDWVISSFNDNLPFDEFVRMQIAGDVLYPDDLSALIATGYHVCGTWDMVGDLEGTAEMQKANRQDHLEDLVATLSQSFLGLTVNCARCHDHKFDPIPQRDYYQLVAFVAGVTQTEEELAEITLSADESQPCEQAFAGSAHAIVPRQPSTVFVLLRGDYRKPTDVALPRGLTALEAAGLSPDLGLSSSSSEAERRQRLAEWLTEPRNPLTPRVFVNRVWHYHFGQGIVDTPSDFGFNGGRPSHPALLDYLTSRFIASGWDVKALHREIVMSATYRQRSQVTSETAETIDAGNRLLWRANRRQLEGESVRDTILQVSGALNPQIGGESFRDVEVALEENHEFTDPTNEFSENTCRRSVYRLWARSGNNPLMDCLDCPDPTVMAPIRAHTITPLQALSLLNNPFIDQCAVAFANRITSAVGDDAEQQVTQLYQIAFSREPTNEEQQLAVQFLTEFGLKELCLATFNTNEFLFVD